MTEHSTSSEQKPKKGKARTKPTSIIPLLSDVPLTPLEEFETPQPIESVKEMRKMYNILLAHFTVLLNDEINSRAFHPDILKFSSEIRKWLEMLTAFEIKIGESKKGKASPQTKELIDYFSKQLTEEDKEKIAARLDQQIKIIDANSEEAKQNGSTNKDN